MKETIDKQQTQIRELIDKNKVVDLDYKEEYYKLEKENYKLKKKIEELIKELGQDDINMTKKYKEKNNITGELLGIDKVRVRAYREKTREIKEKLQKLLSDWKKGK